MSYDSSTRYGFFRRISEILAPRCPDTLFDYITHAMDDNGGFLRSRYCYREDQVLRDKNGNYSRPKVLVTVIPPFFFDDPSSYYETQLRDPATQYTRLKFQLFYEGGSDDESLQEDAEWAAQADFTSAVVIDMINGTYTVSETETIF